MKKNKKYIELISEVQKLKKLHSLTNKDIAVATGYSKKTIDNFMIMIPVNTTKNVALALAEYFNIKDKFIYLF